MPATHRGWSPADVREMQHESGAWPRYELIDGELLVTPAPGNVHQIAAQEFNLLIAPFVARERLGIAYFSPADLELRAGTVTQPDLFVVPAGPGANVDLAHWSDISRLLLAVEILSPSSVRTDRVTKRDFYLESNVAEYWVVDVDARVVERWTPDRATPMVERAGLRWHPSGAATALVIELPALFSMIRDKASWIQR